MTTVSLPIISSCTADGCAYNHDAGCHAGAVTIVGEHSCGTFVASDVDAGGDTTATVGACHRSDCSHNSALECTASGVEIGVSADHADCLTYTHAA